MIKKFSPWSRYGSITRKFFPITDKKAIHFSNSYLNNENEQTVEGRRRQPPSPPPADLCCQSGCTKCVWVEYCHELVEFYKNDGLERAEQELKYHVKDPSLRMFIKMELKQTLKHK